MRLSREGLSRGMRMAMDPKTPELSLLDLAKQFMKDAPKPKFRLRADIIRYREEQGRGYVVIAAYIKDGRLHFLGGNRKQYSMPLEAFMNAVEKPDFTKLHLGSYGSHVGFGPYAADSEWVLMQVDEEINAHFTELAVKCHRREIDAIRLLAERSGVDISSVEMDEVRGPQRREYKALADLHSVCIHEYYEMLAAIKEELSPSRDFPDEYDTEEDFSDYEVEEEPVATGVCYLCGEDVYCDLDENEIAICEDCRQDEEDE